MPTVSVQLADALQVASILLPHETGDISSDGIAFWVSSAIETRSETSTKSMKLSICPSNSFIHILLMLRDHEVRNACPPLDVFRLLVLTENIPLKYPSLGFGDSAPEPDFTLNDHSQTSANSASF
ncbi:hypothetical protein V8E55_012003 [Tylopilus felleus]